ncbi:NAD(+) synthase [Clostridium estertheticum]|uniref:Glutamine-dependent NAD(+) synthetase n=1 Tax=Clostridium estertheticum subsp. estertheticum TaxID=1552 RepID=A0A1J0GKH2_9CLOT|nr:NAD(+) synthase [Clostridium estertheticum]APC41845.1 NAD(+) synthase [Clostridium estertheticum subsp. estertheticum]MBU3173189.1 NAD(+) synthase [Clostridium estertheticum]MBZ9616258.1 NAD(+) synthase [Clostridium estertheticum subsp. laramiense]WAG72001.1 NAD(+) synthase [Clostridium estertheticum]
MKTSFIKVSAACPIVNVADIEFNLTNIQKCIKQAYAERSKFIVFPELCITAYTCSDLFSQQRLLEKSEDAIKSLCEFSENKDILIAVGSPLYFNDCLYNCAYIIFNGKLLGIVPKSYIPNYSEFYEKRWFAEGLGIINKTVDLSFASDIPFGTNLLFTCDNIKFGFEICEDLWVTIPPSSYLSLQGANIIANLSASNELVSKADYRKSLVSSQSARCMCSYLYASSGVFESSTDLVFSGHLLIGENGLLLKENNRFQRENEVITSIIDINKLNSERMKNTSFRNTNSICPFEVKEISFQFENMDFGIFDRDIDKYPFVPSDQLKREVRCAEIFNIQSSALAKRFSFTGLNKAIVGISGGLDSTLALLVIVKTFDKLKIPLKNIITITMPGFGTTDRTYLNAVNLCKNLGTDLREINIVDACLLHFKDIGHPVGKHDVTYENVQARERTQILMDLANKEGGLLIGTGDLSELALGWCTYNGDHMSMYSVNCSIPKTLVRYLVKYVADKESSKEVADILLDILDTPVSPELMPKDKSGKITQKTEDIVGPYVLHDFFLYYFMKQGATPEKILFLAKQAFIGDFEEIIIIKWFDKFIKRFFTQQFKRSALPDGPKVGTISVSPRGDLRMPSDASYNSFL